MENATNVVEEEVMHASEAQQKIDEIHTVHLPRQRSVLEHFLFVGSGQTGIIHKEKKEENSSKPIKELNTEGCDDTRVQFQNDRYIK